VAKSEHELIPKEQKLTSDSERGGFVVRNQSGFSTLYRLADIFFIVTIWYLSLEFF